MLESSAGIPWDEEVRLAGEMAKHEGLVRWVVRQSRLWGMPFDDAVHEGRIGLWRALRLYDPWRGTALSTYAVPAIRRAVWDAVARYREEAPRDGVSREDEQTPISRFVSSFASSDSRYEDDLVEGLHGVLVHAELRRLVDQLPSRQQQIVVSHYGFDRQEPQTFAAIGQTLGVTRQRVQQLHLAALVCLAQPSRSLALRQLCDRNRRVDYQLALARQYRLARVRRGRASGASGASGARRRK